MAKIKINEDKYKIMNNLQKKKSRNNNDNSLSSTSKATLIINDHSIECKITPSNKGERVLGIYINAHNKTQQTISKAKMIVYSHYIALAKKKMTHDHVAYIIDKIILPKLEYIFQHTIINYTQCQKLLAPLKKLFSKQVKSQLNILSALFNTAVLRPIVLQKLDVLSSEIWYPTIPNCLYKYADISTHASYLTKSLALISLYNFNINLTSQRTILGDHVYGSVGVGRWTLPTYLE
ncbi:hypothetical protein RhiirC2_802371 [Rhizophagus irregularis]|uniref:Uncharacterized protein n=1 Tax=Rhizophagus irregularis TaxID=588596 RepID=A0A2N1M1E3_9GLOM|nr:hypothetical protein RhiirC2_802371 [Rhizophagus irregularis]